MFFSQHAPTDYWRAVIYKLTKGALSIFLVPCIRHLPVPFLKLLQLTRNLPRIPSQPSSCVQGQGLYFDSIHFAIETAEHLSPSRQQLRKAKQSLSKAVAVRSLCSCTCFIRWARRGAVLGQGSPAGVLITWGQVLNPVEGTVCFGPSFWVIFLCLRAWWHCGNLAILWAWHLVLFPGQDFPIDNNSRSLAVALCSLIFHGNKALL